MEQKPKIVLAPQDKTLEYEAQVERLLAALGHTEALVTDESTFGDFVWSVSGAQDQHDLDEMMAAAGLPKFPLFMPLWEAAKQIKESENET